MLTFFNNKRLETNTLNTLNQRRITNKMVPNITKTRQDKKQLSPVKSGFRKEYQRHTSIKSKDLLKEEKDKMVVDDDLVSESDGLKHMTSGNNCESLSNGKKPSPEHEHIKKLIERLHQDFFKIAFFGEEDLDKLAFMDPYEFNEIYNNVYDLDNLEFIREAAANVATEREEEKEAKLLLKLYIKTKTQEQKSPKPKRKSPRRSNQIEIKTNKTHQQETMRHRTRSGTKY